MLEMNHIISRSISRYVGFSQRFLHATPSCCLASKRRGGQTRNKQLHSSNEKRPNGGKRKIEKGSITGRRSLHYAQSMRNRFRINDKSFTIEEDKAYLQLADRWTTPSSTTSNHPSVQEIWKRIK